MSSINRLPVVDTHHHLWDLSANDYPWLTDRITTRVCGEYSAIRKNYLLEDFFGDGIGPEVMRETLKVLKGALSGSGDSRVEFSEHPLKNQKEVFNDQKNRFRAYRSGDRRHV